MFTIVLNSDISQAIPKTASAKRLVKKYLEFCWSLPYYGSAFFHGQIETPARSLTSLLINHDTEVLVAINPQGFFVIDPVNVVRKSMDGSLSRPAFRT